MSLLSLSPLFISITFLQTCSHISILFYTFNVHIFVLWPFLSKGLGLISNLSWKVKLLFSSLRKVTWKKKKVLSHLFLILEKLNQVKFPRLLVASPFTLQFSTFCFSSSSKVHYPTSVAFCLLQMSAVQREVKNIKWLQHTGTHRPHKISTSMIKLKQHDTKFPNTHLLLYHMIS